MTNQQLKAHCEDVIANPQEYSEIVLAMAKALLPCLRTEPKYQIRPNNRRGWIDIDTEDLAIHHRDNMDYEMREYYTAPPVPELKPIELPVMQVDNPIDGFLYKCDEVIEAIRAAGYEVTS